MRPEFDILMQDYCPGGLYSRQSPYTLIGSPRVFFQLLRTSTPRRLSLRHVFWPSLTTAMGPRFHWTGRRATFSVEGPAPREGK